MGIDQKMAEGADAEHVKRAVKGPVLHVHRHADFPLAFSRRRPGIVHQGMLGGIGELVEGFVGEGVDRQEAHVVLGRNVHGAVGRVFLEIGCLQPLPKALFPAARNGVVVQVLVEPKHRPENLSRPEQQASWGAVVDPLHHGLDGAFLEHVQIDPRLCAEFVRELPGVFQFEIGSQGANPPVEGSMDKIWCDEFHARFLSRRGGDPRTLNVFSRSRAGAG